MDRRAHEPCEGASYPLLPAPSCCSERVQSLWAPGGAGVAVLIATGAVLLSLALGLLSFVVSAAVEAANEPEPAAGLARHSFKYYDRLDIMWLVAANTIPLASALLLTGLFLRGTVPCATAVFLLVPNAQRSVSKDDLYRVFGMVINHAQLKRVLLESMGFFICLVALLINPVQNLVLDVVIADARGCQDSFDCFALHAVNNLSRLEYITHCASISNQSSVALVCYRLQTEQGLVQDLQTAAALCAGAWAMGRLLHTCFTMLMLYLFRFARRAGNACGIRRCRLYVCASGQGKKHTSKKKE
jgi:hypothetical protein